MRDLLESEIDQGESPRYPAHALSFVEQLLNVTGTVNLCTFIEKDLSATEEPFSSAASYFSAN